MQPGGRSDLPHGIVCEAGAKRQIIMSLPSPEQNHALNPIGVGTGFYFDADPDPDIGERKGHSDLQPLQLALGGSETTIGTSAWVRRPAIDYELW